MENTIEQKIIDMGIILPEPVKAAAHYQPIKQDGGLLYVSGQLPWSTNGIITGRLTNNDQERLKAAQDAARLCGLHILAQVKKNLGSLNQVTSIIRVTGYVNCSEGCTEIPFIIDGVSNLFIKIFGTSGYHARSAIGCSSLPLGAIAEVEAIFSGSRIEGGYAIKPEITDSEKDKYLFGEDIAPGG